MTHSHRPEATLQRALDSLTRRLNTEGDVGALFQQMDWAEDEIQLALAAVAASDADLVYHSFPLLTPTHPLMQTDWIYQAHCREIISILVGDGDTTIPTATELVCWCSDASLKVPASPAGSGLYLRSWRRAFPDRPIDTALASLEALESAAIDRLEAEIARKLSNPARRLQHVDCDGWHSGRRVACRFAKQP